MIAVDIKFTGLYGMIDAFRHMEDAVLDGLISGTRKAAFVLLPPARKEAPKRTGRLAKSVFVTRNINNGQVYLVLGANAPYAKYVYYGTRPHIIRPKNAKFLRFEVDGRVVFAKLVHHPGTKPNPWLEGVAKKYGPEAIRRMREEVYKKVAKYLVKKAKRR